VVFITVNMFKSCEILYYNSGHAFLPNYMLVLCSHKDDIHFKQNSA